MLYLPKRAVFIHVPRAAGNAITSAIATACAGRGIDTIIGTSGFISHWGLMARHIRASELKKYIEEWDQIYKFAIYRKQEDRARSALRLIERDVENKIHEQESCPQQWKDVLTGKTRQQYWERFMKNNIDWYTKGENQEDIGVEVWDYERLNENWPIICERCNIPQCTLERLNIGPR
tara:strand:+ start:3449 stop:3979 length:531 start_codon:yes stop_codon:yes gene_type:complete